MELNSQEESYHCDLFQRLLEEKKLHWGLQSLL